MRFCLLVTVALDIFMKEKTFYFISSLDFSFVIFLCKRCLLSQSQWRNTLLTIFRPPGYCTPPTPLLYFTQIYTPSLCFLEPPPHPIYLRSQYNYEQASYEACFSWIIFISLVLALVSYSFFLCYIGNLPFKYVLTKKQLIMERKILLEGFLSYQKGISLIDAFIIL